MMPPFDPEKPLARLVGEPLKNHAALLDYYGLGDGRSLSKLIERYRDASKTSPTVRIATLKKWSAEWAWQARIEAQKLLDDAEDARIWAERRQAIREADFQQAEKLRGLADKMLEKADRFIKQKRRRIKGRDGAPDREIITLELNPRLLIDAAKLASDLGRRAAGMETETVKINDWRVEVIDLLKKGLVTPAQVQEDFGDDADELLRAAGLPAGSRPV